MTLRKNYRPRSYNHRPQAYMIANDGFATFVEFRSINDFRKLTYFKTTINDGPIIFRNNRFTYAGHHLHKENLIADEKHYQSMNIPNWEFLCSDTLSKTQKNKLGPCAPISLYIGWEDQLNTKRLPFPKGRHGPKSYDVTGFWGNIYIWARRIDEHSEDWNNQLNYIPPSLLGQLILERDGHPITVDLHSHLTFFFFEEPKPFYDSEPSQAE